MDNAATSTIDAVQLSADIVMAFVSNNSLQAAELPALLKKVYAAVNEAVTGSGTAPEPINEKVTPAQIRKSITPDALISFIDGKPYKTLKRHLGTHGLGFEGYRARYGLPADYPTVAANYSAARSALARDLGLGQQRLKPTPKASTASSTQTDKPKRGRAAKSLA